MHAEIVLDLFILLAKYYIVHAETNNGNPLIQVFVRTVKRFVVKKYNAVIKDNTVNFKKEWTLYSHFSSYMYPCDLSIHEADMVIVNLTPYLSLLLCLCVCMKLVYSIVPSGVVDIMG